MTESSIRRDSVLLVFGDGLKFTASFVTSMILARIITINDMATYRQIIYLGPLAVSIVEFGLNSSIYRFWNELCKEMRSTYIKMVILLSGLMGGIASITLAVFAPYLASWYKNPDLKIALLICCAFPFTNIITQIIRPVMINKGQPFKATIIQLMFSLAKIVAIIIPINFRNNLFQALFYWMIVNFFEVIITLIILNHEIFLRTPWWSKKIFIDIWNYLWPIQVGRIPGIFTGYTDKIATSVYLSTDEFAAYSLGAREIPFIGQIGYSISSVLIPKMVSYNKDNRIEEICDLWKRAIKRTSLFIYPIIGFCIVFSEPIVEFLFSATYKESSIPFSVYSAITFARVIEYASLAKVFGKTRIIMKGAILGSLIMIILAFPLTAVLGTWGILITLFLSVYMTNGYYLFSYTKLLNRPLGDFYPIKYLLFLAIITVTIPFFVGKILDPFLDLSTTTNFFNLGIKLMLLFICCLFLYLTIIFIAKKLKLAKLF